MVENQQEEPTYKQGERRQVAPLWPIEVLVALPAGSRDIRAVQEVSAAFQAVGGKLEGSYEQPDDDDGGRGDGATLLRGTLGDSVPTREIAARYSQLESLLKEQNNAATVQPNWFIGGVPTSGPPGGGGGPGARPTPLQNTGPQMAQLRDAVMDTVPAPALSDAPVRLYILDAWNTEAAEISTHLSGDDLLATICTHCLGGPMPNSDFTLTTLAGQPDPFPMPDHGVFVADVARRVIEHGVVTASGESNTLIRPSAAILTAAGRGESLPTGQAAVLIESVRVLDEFGVGDLGRLVSELTRILDEVRQAKADTPTVPVRAVINLSLYVNLPDPAQVKAADLRERIPSPTNLNPSERLDGLLYKVIQDLEGEGVLLVAAAGNDSMGESRRSEARYPAAYDEVVGVTAAALDGTLEADYANRIGPKGIAVFGGVVRPLTLSEALDRFGDVPITPQMADARVVEPPYLVGRFSDSNVPVLGPAADPTNGTGFVGWAGTSFATPVISGLAARLWASTEYANRDARAVWEAIHELARQNHDGLPDGTAFLPLFEQPAASV